MGRIGTGPRGDLPLHAPGQPDVEPLPPARILLVEDSQADVFLVREAVHREGLELGLEIAENGESAFNILERVDADPDEPAPALLLLDLNVPRRNGIQVLDRLRRSPRCGRIPVIMISSSDSPQDRKRAFDLGATDYFSKPSSLREFMALGSLVRRHLELAAAQSER